MTVNEDMLLAYVDGALGAEDRRRVEEDLKAHPELRAYVERQRTLARALHDSLDEVLAAPIPKALTDMLAVPEKRGVPEGLSWRRIALWSGLPAAAALACGLVIGIMVHPEADIVSSHGGLVAQGRLDQALNRQLASAGGGEVGITFRDKAGRYCRTFTTTGSSPLAGVACHDAGEWHIAAIGATEAERGTYRQAASGMPDFLRSAVSSMISGEPLDAQAEQKARDSEWMTR
jgi:hypothetical protein